jgi:hypothetical protein
MADRPPPPPLSETLKDGFAWSVFFLIGFFLFCKWFSGA